MVRKYKNVNLLIKTTENAFLTFFKFFKIFENFIFGIFIGTQTRKEQNEKIPPLFWLDVENYFSNIPSGSWNFRAIPNLIVSCQKIEIQPPTGVVRPLRFFGLLKRATFNPAPRGSCRDRLVALLNNSSC